MLRLTDSALGSGRALDVAGLTAAVGFGFAADADSDIVTSVFVEVCCGLSSGGVDLDSMEIADVSILSSGCGGPRVTLNVFDRLAVATFFRCSTAEVAEPARLEVAGRCPLRLGRGSVLGGTFTGVFVGIFVFATALAGGGCS